MKELCTGSVSSTHGLAPCGNYALDALDGLQACANHAKLALFDELVDALAMAIARIDDAYLVKLPSQNILKKTLAKAKELVVNAP